MTEIIRVNTAFEREPLLKPFGFKGGYLSELWQPVALLESEMGNQSIGLGTQSVLWSDPEVFAAHSEAGGNSLMFAVLDFATRAVQSASWGTPLDLLDQVFPQAYDYARRITDRSDLRKTFVLNALVALDNAAWLLYARDNEIRSFDELVPEPYRGALATRHDVVASIPAVGYGATLSEMGALAEAGTFVVKVKLGHPGSQRDMLAADKRRLEDVHQVFGFRETDRTASGRIPYYLDINGRYDGVDRLSALVDHADSIGALDHILVVEEPFPEQYEADVSGIGARLAADESAHTDDDARRLIDMGYGAIALKPIAKTVSMTLRIAGEAHRSGVPCFCADLTANPILVDWNKVFAARLAPLPGLDFGLLETNGAQNYLNWDGMMQHHPRAGAAWTTSSHGAFHLDDDFYEADGGIFDASPHYLGLVSPSSPTKSA